MVLTPQNKVVVAGAGVVGTLIALELARLGASVCLIDPAPPGDNASGVAAGMLAPAMEAVLDPAAQDHFDLLLAARDAWPSLAERTGIVIDRSGVLALGGPSRLDDIATRLRTLGVTFERRRDGVFTSADWRLDPCIAMAQLLDAAHRAGVLMIRGIVAGYDGAEVILSDGRKLAARHLVVATGAATVSFAPETAHLLPIKGHILRFPPVSPPGPTVRGEWVYLCPFADSLVVGASMEPGRSDLLVDPGQVETLRAAALRMEPALAGLAPQVGVGVRGASPDGLPLVGPSVAPGVILAVGMRRNGWLLAPLASRMVAAYVAAEHPGPWAGVMAPTRFATIELKRKT